MQSVVLVFVGGGLGAALRHGVNVGVARWLGTGFPWHTLIVNGTGSLAMGLFVGWLAQRGDLSWSQPLRLFLTTGVCGGFTTFSAFSLDAMMLWERGETTAAVFYVAGSVAASLLGLAAGLILMRSL